VFVKSFFGKAARDIRSIWLKIDSAGSFIVQTRRVGCSSAFGPKPDFPSSGPVLICPMPAWVADVIRSDVHPLRDAGLRRFGGRACFRHRMGMIFPNPSKPKPDGLKSHFHQFRELFWFLFWFER